MGWGSGIVRGREVGYLIPDICNAPNCEVPINRGLAYACGGHYGVFGGPDGEQPGCGDYFCYEHLLFHRAARDFICSRCFDELEEFTGDEEFFEDG